jgi:hypothetical protein
LLWLGRRRDRKQRLGISDVAAGGPFTGRDNRPSVGSVGHVAGLRVRDDAAWTASSDPTAGDGDPKGRRGLAGRPPIRRCYQLT